MDKEKVHKKTEHQLKLLEENNREADVIIQNMVLLIKDGITLMKVTSS